MRHIRRDKYSVYDKEYPWDTYCGVSYVYARKYISVHDVPVCPYMVGHYREFYPQHVASLCEKCLDMYDREQNLRMLATI